MLKIFGHAGKLLRVLFAVLANDQSQYHSWASDLCDKVGCTVASGLLLL